MSRGLPERLRDYLNEKYKSEKWFHSYEFIERGKEDEKWELRTDWYDGCGGIREYVDGNVWILSGPLAYLGDGLHNVLLRLYDSRIRSAKNEDEEKRFYDELYKEEEDILGDILHRRNLNKYLKEKEFRDLIIDVLWSEEIARRISQEFRVEVKYLIDDVKWRTYFYSAFDSKNMDENRKFEEMVKRVEAIHAACKTYRLYDENEDYKKFKKKVLAEKKTSYSRLKNLHFHKKLKKEKWDLNYFFFRNLGLGLQVFRCVSNSSLVLKVAPQLGHLNS